MESCDEIQIQPNEGREECGPLNGTSIEDSKTQEGREEQSSEKRISTEAALERSNNNQLLEQIQNSNELKIGERISTRGEKEHVARKLSVIVVTLNMSTLQ